MFVHIYVVTIRVPWGYIAAKAWGYSSGHPVLALHGNVFYRMYSSYVYGNFCVLLTVQMHMVK